MIADASSCLLVFLDFFLQVLLDDNRTRLAEVRSLWYDSGPCQLTGEARAIPSP